jgi:threonine dehydrogenase-like Zn-dependent dehydrogenase
VLPTAWQSVEYAHIPDGGTVLVIGLGPIGDMACRIALHRGHRVIGLDLVDERLQRVAARGAEIVDLRQHDDVAEAIKSMTDGRGPDSVIEAVGLEAHGSPAAKLAHQAVGLLPDKLAEPLMKTGGIDRMNAFNIAIEACRRGGTISLIGVYGGMADPVPMLTIFDKQLQLTMGQANVKRWAPEILPLLTDEDPLGVEEFATHRVPLDSAPEAYEMFQKKDDGAIKVLFKP